MTDQEPAVTMEVRRFTRYALRLVPLWDGDDERIELGGDLQTIIAAIVRDRSVGSLIGHDLKPMRFCRLEQEEALHLPATQQTFYSRERTPVWKVMVPAAGVYSRETIMSCLARGGGRNTEKYENVLFLYPRAAEFYTFATNEIRPVDDSVFVIEQFARESASPHPRPAQPGSPNS